MTVNQYPAEPAASLMLAMRDATQEIHASLERKLRIAMPVACLFPVLYQPSDAVIASDAMSP